MTTEFRLIRKLDEFLALRKSWNELAVQCAVDHAYMRHEWFATWVKHLGEPRELAIYTAWRDGLLVAAAPLRITSQKLKGLPVRTLAFLTSSVAPRCNFLVHPSYSSEEFFENVFCIKGWDMMLLQGLEAGQDITREFLDFLGRRHSRRFNLEPGRQSPYLMVEGGWDDYLQGLSKKHRKNINQGLNRLSKLESHGFRKIHDFAEIECVFDQVVAISDKSWKKTTGTSLSVQEKQRSFYREFCEMGSPDGLWEMRLMKAGDEYIAFNFFLRHGNRLSGIRTDFDEKYKYYGPGQMMIYFTLMDLFSGGEKWEFDMGGMAADFKLDWTEKTREHYIVNVANPSFYGGLLALGQNKIMPMVNRLKRSMSPPAANGPGPE